MAATQTKVKKRDRERTKGKILKAVGEVIEQHGTEKVGVNLIARHAGVNKVLIYRYFGGVDGLMEQYVKTGQYTSTSSLEYIESLPVPASEERAKVWGEFLATTLRDLREKKATRDLIRWEIGAGKPVLTDARNDVATRILAKIGHLPNYPHTNVLLALLVGGLYHLVVSADYRDKFMDVDLQSADEWKQIESTLREIIETMDQR
jgi:AcrR family transcriptional regulator